MPSAETRRFRRSLACSFHPVGLAVLLACAAPGIARADIPGVEDWAQAVSYQQGPYEGPRVPFPDTPRRPDGATLPLQSEHMPLAVHLGEGVRSELASRTLDALELVYALAEAASWPLPFPDGGRGSTAGFDLYLQHDPARMAHAGADTSVSWTGLDSATSFAVVDAAVDPDALEACVAQAFADAALLARDPAEAAGWRRSTAAFFAWLATGRFGCDTAVAAQQRHPERAWLGSEPLAGGALFLAMLSEREDGGSGDFVRELWQFARQQSAPGARLRKTPRLWQALDRALENAGQSLDEVVEDFAVARYFAGGRAQHAPFQSLANASAAVPVHDLPARALPWHSEVMRPPLQVFGSQYTRLEVEGVKAGRKLQVWMRGETGVRWSMIAVRLDADGHERGRVVASGGEEPRRYAPVVLTEDTASVLVVVTNLGVGVPDARHPRRHTRSFRLIASLE